MYSATKRSADIVLSLMAVVLFFPLMFIVAIAIRAESSGSIVYAGVRAGLNGKPFRVLKFRTMVENAENLGGYSTAVDDPRMTRVGSLFRKFKIDELPQFFNVLSGEMSLVGPRPQVLFYTERYNLEERNILSVKPGITDLASIYFSNMDAVLGSGAVDEMYLREIEPVKNKLRLQYVRNRSFILDMRILIETAGKLVGIPGITRLKISP
jgi:lipopolysaccharide/colanic/teichoic acid biosynthesis glycosyltransferase